MKKNNPEKKQHSTKKLPYIGVITLVFVGFVSILSSHFFTKMTTPTENIETITLPALTLTDIAPLEPQPTEKQTPTPTLTTSERADEPVAEEVMQAVPVFGEGTPFTIIKPAEGEILTPFSDETLLYSKTLCDWRTHPAIDILAPSGTDVCAAADGVVEKIYCDPLMGETFVIAHGEQFKTIYQNLASTQMLSVGQRVTAGQVIAVVGNTAPAELLEKSHLHFAVTENDRFVNPDDYFVTEP